LRLPPVTVIWPICSPVFAVTAEKKRLFGDGLVRQRMPHSKQGGRETQHPGPISVCPVLVAGIALLLLLPCGLRWSAHRIPCGFVDPDASRFPCRAIRAPPQRLESRNCKRGGNPQPRVLLRGKRGQGHRPLLNLLKRLERQLNSAIRPQTIMPGTTASPGSLLWNNVGAVGPPKAFIAGGPRPPIRSGPVRLRLPLPEFTKSAWPDLADLAQFQLSAERRCTRKITKPPLPP